MAERLTIPTGEGGEGKSDLYLELEGEHRGQFFIVPEDDFYTCHTSMAPVQLQNLAKLLEHIAGELLGKEPHPRG